METSRRTFLKTSGCLTIGFSIFGCNKLSGDYDYTEAISTKPNEDQINAWLRVLKNGSIEVITGKMELGQGVRTAIMQIAAEELNTSLELVSIRMAETGYTADEGYTAGSRSIESSAMSVRAAAATARELMIKMAADQWDLDVNKLSVRDGKVVGNGHSLTFAKLLEGKQLTDRVNPGAEILAKSARKIVGQPIPREDIVHMVRGELTYVQDLRFPGMVHARVVRPSSHTASLIGIDDSALDDEDALLKLVREGSFVAVVAEEEYDAIRLADSVKKRVSWSEGKKLPKGSLKEYLLSLPTSDETDVNTGNHESAITSSAKILRASYFKPYIMHASNGPSCSVAKFENGKLDIWTHSQGVYPLRRSISAMLGIKEEDIHIKGVHGSGCYGHNGADDVAAEAAIIATKLPGVHVRLQWMRDEEHGWEPYGTAMISNFEAGLDAKGKIKTWKYDLWSDGHSTRPGGNPDSLLPARFLGKGFGQPGTGFRGGAVRNAPPYYAFEHVQVNSHIFSGPLRNSALRGLGAYANIYAIESFMDELVHLAEKDPVSFRLEHLEDFRAIECIKRLYQMVDNLTPGSNEGIGYAFSRYKNRASYFAVAALVSVNRNSGKPIVKKMWGVIDAGECINPDGLKNQTEGGMIQSASWCLYEQVTYDSHHINSLDWVSYPIIRAGEVPELEVEVIDRANEAPLGAGEAAQGPSTAAILNAIFDATGVRIRNLPIDQADLKS